MHQVKVLSHALLVLVEHTNQIQVRHHVLAAHQDMEIVQVEVMNNQIVIKKLQQENT